MQDNKKKTYLSKELTYLHFLGVGNISSYEIKIWGKFMRCAERRMERA
jgi:hypothetical protein